MPQESTEEKVEGQEQEIWKSVKGYEEYYSVSILGKIKIKKSRFGSIIGNELKLRKNKKGYLVVFLCKNGKRALWKVHRIVAIAFLGTPPRGLQVNHKDGIKTNNHASNLEYVTASENVRHAWRLGLCKPHPRENGIGGLRGEKNSAAKLKEKDVLEIRELFSMNIHTKNELSTIYKISKRTIRDVVNRETWVHI